ncbi:hypothetical protein ACI77O_11930 [Pseudomonas tritici]|uniref:hypothetical protein n=1 Tax=Pseudomonas tritici TaxID=2745518 RepID=UPI00387B336D
MLSIMTHTKSNKRFAVYVALLFVLALTASSWIPATSPIFDAAPFLKLALIPLAMWFLLRGARHRWPANYRYIVLASCMFYAGLIISTAYHGFIK